MINPRVITEIQIVQNILMSVETPANLLFDFSFSSSANGRFAASSNFLLVAAAKRPPHNADEAYKDDDSKNAAYNSLVHIISNVCQETVDKQ